MKRLFCIVFLGMIVCLKMQAQYEGTPYPDGTPHPIPGIIQAEHFDDGGEGISWHDSNPGQSNNSGIYRPDTDVEFVDLDNDNYKLSWTTRGEWLKYTVNVTQAGYYKVFFRLSAQSDHYFSMKWDDVEMVYFVVNTGNYNTYKEIPSSYIALSEGIHVFTIFPDGADLDWYNFEFVGETLGNIPTPQLKINEIMSNNVSDVMDESYNYSMWVELYNCGQGVELLDNYYFTDDLTNPKKWGLKDQWIPAGQFRVLWFEREELANHASFKLEPGGGRLFLLDKNANIVDQVRYNKQYRNVSYGRIDDVGDTWAYFTEFSLGASNIDKKQGKESACSEPGFSLPGGFYDAPIDLSLTTWTSDAKIYYTTDGSEPNEESNLFVDGENININKTTCIRAIVLSDDYLPSPMLTNTYFINERRFNLPVVSIVTEEKNLKDDMIGIYVQGTNGLAGNGTGPANWNQDWDRPSNIELYDTLGVMRINQEIDISISGAWSRPQPQKSLKLQPRHKFGDNRLRYDFFAATKPGHKYKDILFRNSGSDFWRSMMRDALMQSLIMGRMDIDYQAYEPAVCFINGEYYGIQNLRERTNKDYLYSNYNLSEDEFILIDHREAPIYPEYVKFRNYLKNNNTNESEVYDNAAKQIDIDSYSYYMMAEMYYNNTDWPHNNYKIWKKNDGTGKWRWILFDTDFGFNNNQHENALTYVLDFSNDNITTPLRRLLLNTNFKNHFIDRYAIHLSSTFEPNRVIAFIDSLSAKIRPEMVYHKQKWGGNNFENELNVMKSFAKARQGNMMGFLSDYFFQSTPIRDIYISSNLENSTYLFNNDTIQDNSIRMKYFQDQKVSVEASEVPGYYFSHWEITQTLIPSASNWRYWDNYEQPAAYWNASSYDDSAWKTGNAPLGYGNNYLKNTIIGYGNNVDNKYPTAYFRKTIMLDNWSDLSNFRLTCYVDDGVAFYVNGQEIGRLNLPAGNLIFDTFALDSNNGINGEWFIPKDYFHEGVNTIAAEVHQCNAQSSDLLFECNLFHQAVPQSKVQTYSDPVYSFTLEDDISLKAIYKSDYNDLQNPTVSVIKLQLMDNILSVENAAGKTLCIYDLTGRPMQKNLINGDNMQLNLSSWQSGVYVVRIDNRGFKILIR